MASGMRLLFALFLIYVAADLALAYTEEDFSEMQDTLQRHLDRIQDELVETRQGMAFLQRLLAQSSRKRTCKVNLGGNCATEDAVAMSDHWHFLNSAHSPGRRRRSAPVAPLSADSPLTATRLPRQPGVERS